ncbi:MAG TPA: protein kinase [Ktedonobacterales bacterium]|jgi:serine/threonine protein kinase
MADRVGEQLGNYRLLKLIGRGGFADVYLGEHVRLGNQAAIKVLQTRLESEDIESFQQEARTIGRLTHPNIVRVFDFAVQDGTPFLAMDYAPNGTLRQRYEKGAQAPLDAIIVYVRQVADALQYAHEQRVVHRDVKPENMLIGRLNDILISDFGIAVVSQSSRYQTSKEMVGTVGYMSPEQIQGHPRPASDQYSLGVVVYEWLCGSRPFSGSVTEVATQHLVVAPPPLRKKVPTLASAVEDVVMTALAKDPDQRFGSMRAFATALENAAHAEPSIYSLSTQVNPPIIPPLPGTPSGPHTPSGPNAPAVWSGPSGGPGSGASVPSGGQESDSTPFAPTIAESLPAGGAWGDAETVRSSQAVGSQPSGGPAPAMSDMYGNPSHPWPYGALPGGPQVDFPPPPPPPPPGARSPGSYFAPAAPVVTAPPPKARRSPVLWIVLALIVLLVGGGSATAYAVLTTPHPFITVTSNATGSALSVPPDTILHISGEKFSGNSTITILLDGARAPGAQLVQSDGKGSFTTEVTITDDWTFNTHTLTAKDAKGYVAQNSASIVVIPQPVLDVHSDYQDGTTPAGSSSTSFTITGRRFAPNSTVTFLLDGGTLPGSQPTLTDARGRVEVTLTVTGDWTLGRHTITAQDDQGHSTQTAAPVEIVRQGEAGTPGPHGAPTDNATFNINVTIHTKNASTGEAETFTMTLDVSNGKVCDNSTDTGEPQHYKQTFSDGTFYNETYVLKCSGTYKAGHLVYTQTTTQDTFDLSDGGLCVGETPRVSIRLVGNFSSTTKISGTFRNDAERITCPRIVTFYLLSSNAQTGTWTGNA